MFLIEKGACAAVKDIAFHLEGEIGYALCVQTKLFLLVILQLPFWLPTSRFFSNFPSVFPSLSLVSLRRFPFCLARCDFRLFSSFNSDAPEAYTAL